MWMWFFLDDYEVALKYMQMDKKVLAKLTKLKILILQRWKHYNV